MIGFDRALLESLVADGWLRCMRHPDADLWIYNYTERTQFENHWTPETLACRGLILDAAGAIVARPFAKFFNYGTPQATDLPAEPFWVTEKIDGSLGILYYLGDAPCIATRGSFVSEQAVQGTAMIREEDIERTPGVTPLFEIVYLANRIVVDYAGRRELILLAAIDNATGIDAPLPAYSGPVVSHYGQIPLDRLAGFESSNREGFVVAFQSGLRVKVKLAEYVRLHKLVTGVNARWVWDSMRNGDSLDALLEGIPDELQQWAAGIRDDIQQAYDALVNDARRVFVAAPDADRKGLAAYFLASGANTAVLFRMLDGRPYAELAWRAVKPEALTPLDVALEDFA